MEPNRTVLVVAAHADDEVMGCGGAMARHVAAGDPVHILYLTDGVSARAGTEGREAAQRRSAAQEAGTILGVSSQIFYDFPDNRLDSVALIEVARVVEEQVEKLRPAIVYTHHYGDLNVDHKAAHQAVMVACRAQPGCSVREIFAFEVMSSTEWSSPTSAPFLPNVFVDITQVEQRKMQALEAYALEMRTAPHSRCAEHILQLGRHRGHCVGVGAAEAFMLMRMIR